MLAIFKKEINLFFSSLIGYISIGVFLVLTGMFMWILPNYNIFDFGFATLDQLFTIVPFVFLFLIPAITMRSFAEEQKTGTIEIISTKPVTDFQIVFGKYLAGLVLVIFSLLPTLLYFYTVSDLAFPKGNVDTGAAWGSYIGLLFIGGAYLAIGLFASSVTDNQIVSFILGMFLCFFFFQLLNFLKDISFLTSFNSIFDALSLQSHYLSISKGVLDTRDLVYFITFIGIFLFSTKTVIQSRKW
jgi:ABC-2 type transport system permease protein